MIVLLVAVCCLVAEIGASNTSAAGKAAFAGVQPAPAVPANQSALPPSLIGMGGTVASPAATGGPDTIDAINFDSQPLGQVETGSVNNEFGGADGSPNLTVENTIANSTPNALSVAASSSSGSYGYTRYGGSGYTDHTLQFSIELGDDFVLPTSDYLVLTGGNLSLHLDYVDSAGNQHYLFTTGSLNIGSWHTISVADTVGAPADGTLSVMVDGAVVGSASGIDTGNSPVGYFAVGDEFNSPDPAIAGHFYFDDITTSTDEGAPPTTTATASPTTTGVASPSTVSINFDDQPIGSVQTGSDADEFTGVAGPANLTVENAISDSAPNAMSVTATSASGAYGYVRYAGAGYLTHTLEFSVYLGADFVLPSSDYLVLAQTQPVAGGNSTAGKVSVVLTGGNLGLHLDYVDSLGNQHYLYTDGFLTIGAWHTIVVQDAVGAGSSGSLGLSLDGSSVGSAAGIDTGSAPVGYFAVGDEYSTPDTNIAGHFYIDNITSTSPSAAPPTVTPTPTGSPTVTPTGSPFPTVTASPSPSSTPTSTGTANPIEAENALPGTTSWALTDPAEGGQIEGYGSLTAVQQGSTISFSVSTSAASFSANIYRMGWYGGDGARLMDSIPSMPGGQYPVPGPDENGLIVPAWPTAFSVTVPGTWVSGVYLVKLIASSGYQEYIPFTVTDTRPSALIFVHAVNTDEAYNPWHDKSLYGDDAYTYGSAQWSANRAYMVTYERPFSYYQDAGAGLFLSYEYPMVRWLERNGYDVSYTTDVSVDENPSQLLDHKGIIIAGHNEYWSQGIFNAYQQAVNDGVNLAVFGGDIGSWQIRYEPLGSTPDGIEVCYKDATLDPLTGIDDSLVTVHWADPLVNRPASALLGEGGPDNESAQVNPPAPWVVADAGSWVFAGTGLQNGQSIPGLVGYEYNRIVPGQAVPANETILAASPVTNVTGGENTADSTLYTAPSGALVVDVGSIEWSWGLDNTPIYDFESFPYNDRPEVTSPLAQIIAANIMNAIGS